MRTLVGVVSYAGLPFLEAFLRSVQETLKTPNTDVLVVVAKPGDHEMRRFLDDRGIRYIQHDRNWGFPASCNDLYDAAFVNGDYDNLVFCGNDVVLLEGSLDSMIHAAETTNFEMLCGSEFNSRFMYDQYPEVRKYFDGPNLNVTQEGLNARFWERHKDFRSDVEPDTRKDVRNFTLFKRSAFEKVGYDDVSFYVNGYFCDNCVCRRCDILGVSAAGLQSAPFYHHWSRTIFQGESRPNGTYFQRNQEFYVHKYGGLPGQEKYELPFDGRGFQLTPDIFLKPELKIASRDQELSILNYWSNLK